MDSSVSERLSDNAPAKRHLRNLLIDKKFQLGWVIKVSAMTSLVVAGMGFFLYRTVADATDLMLAGKLGEPSLTPEALQAFIDQAGRDKMFTVATLVLGLFAIVLMLSSLTILWTHKIAGPAFKMRKICSTIDGNHLQLRAKLRKADELQSTFVDFEDMLRRLRDNRREDIEALDSLMTKLESVDCEDAKADLKEILERYRGSIRMD